MVGLVPVRGADPEDLDWILALNTRFQDLLSPLGRGELAEMLDEAVLARVIPSQRGFLLAFDQDTDYGSENFLWFRKQFDKFLYIDRIAIDDTADGQGRGRHLYDDATVLARNLGYPRICAEVNVQPPNQKSLDFHEKRGFQPIADAAIGDGSKTVRYLVLDL